MTGRERIQKILARESDACGYWHGHPHDTAEKQIFSHFGVANDFELGRLVGSDLYWAMPEEHGSWKHPESKPTFDVLAGEERHSLGQDGVFANTEDPREIEDFPWPDVANLDFTAVLAKMDQVSAAGQAIFSGMWSCFFHIVSDFFGMENYFMKMHTHPEVVDAVTRRVVDFYLQANELLFDQAGDKIDAYFFGNDLGSQLNLLVSPDSFDRFVYPYMKELIAPAKRRGYAVAHHSCGAIDRIIPRLIDASVDIIHPIQAQAVHMSARELRDKYGDSVIFMGGVDAQGILPFGTEDELRAEVKRLTGILGPNYIVSPSHESILPNIHPEKLRVMPSSIDNR